MKNLEYIYHPKSKLKIRLAENLDELKELLSTSKDMDVLVYFPQLPRTFVGIMEATKDMEAIKYLGQKCKSEANVYTVPGKLWMHFMNVHAVRLRDTAKSLPEYVYPKAARFNKKYMD